MRKIFLSKFLGRPRKRYHLPVILALAGLIIFVLHFSLIGYPRLAIAAESIGLSIVITTLVTTAVNISFEAGLYSAFEIIRGCTDSEITHIYATRNEAIPRIEEQVGTTNKTIDILAVAGTDFLGPSCKAVKNIAERCQQKSNVFVRVLLLDPRSYFAVERCLIEERIDEVESIRPEEFGYPDKRLCRAIVDSLSQLEMILAKLKQDKTNPFQLQVRTYNDTPQFMCVRVDNHMFVEPYHKGAIDNDTILSTRLGKTVPMLRTTITSNIGQVLKAQFEHLWDNSEERSFQPGCLRILERELRQIDWIAEFQRRYHDTQEALKVRVLVDRKPPQRSDSESATAATA